MKCQDGKTQATAVPVDTKGLLDSHKSDLPPNIAELAKYIGQKRNANKIDLLFKITVQKVN